MAWEQSLEALAFRRGSSHQLLRKERKPSLELALRIEEYTRGQVSATELREGKNIPTFSENQPIEKRVEAVETDVKELKEKVASLEKVLDL